MAIPDKFVLEDDPRWTSPQAAASRAPLKCPPRRFHSDSSVVTQITIIRKEHEHDDKSNNNFLQTSTKTRSLSLCPPRRTVSASASCCLCSYCRPYNNNSIRSSMASIVSCCCGATNNTDAQTLQVLGENLRHMRRSLRKSKQDIFSRSSSDGTKLAVENVRDIKNHVHELVNAHMDPSTYKFPLPRPRRSTSNGSTNSNSTGSSWSSGTSSTNFSYDDIDDA